MNIRNLIDGAISLAKMASPLIPGLGAGAAIAQKIEGIFDDLHEHADLGQQTQMQAERINLAAAVSAKAKAESAALRG